MASGSKQRKKHGGGSFDVQKYEAVDIGYEDFGNIWSFTNLFRSPNEIVFPWLREHGILAEELKCIHCDQICRLNKRSSKSDGFTFRCKNGHEFGMRKYSFFEGSSFDIRDLIVFIKAYLEGSSLHQISKFTNMDYKNTSVNWASYIRELFCEYVYRAYQNVTLEGEIEIDESLFGRKIKYNRGNPTGTRIWIFGMVERASNKLILYPVDDRSAQTLIPIIQKHVRPGSRIYSDSWAAYFKLNEVGYEHFSVVHKTSFNQKYVNTQTGEEVSCCTNRIEGAWKISKDHFRRINGSNTKLFEQHLAEIIWRNHIHRQNIYAAFFELLTTVYPLDRPADFSYTKPLFKTWTPPSKEVEKHHNITIIQESDGESNAELAEEEPSTENQTEEPNLPEEMSISSTHGNKTPENVTKRKTLGPSQRAGPSVRKSTVIDLTFEETDDEERINLFFPKQYKPLKKQANPAQSKTDKAYKPLGKRKATEKGKGRGKGRSNTYSKSAFVYDWSTDDDFV